MGCCEAASHPQVVSIEGGDKVAEKVIVRQKSTYEISFFAADPEDESGDALLSPVAYIHELSPYGMLLASIGSCTTILLHSYAQNRGMKLDEVEMRLEYQRSFKEDCDNCEEIERYEEIILIDIALKGRLSEQEKQRLLAISHQCPVHRIVEDGIKTELRLKDSFSTDVEIGHHHHH